VLGEAADKNFPGITVRLLVAILLCPNVRNERPPVLVELRQGNLKRIANIKKTNAFFIGRQLDRGGNGGGLQRFGSHGRNSEVNNVHAPRKPSLHRIGPVSLIQFCDFPTL